MFLSLLKNYLKIITNVEKKTFLIFFIINLYNMLLNCISYFWDRYAIISISICYWYFHLETLFLGPTRPKFVEKRPPAPPTNISFVEITPWNFQVELRKGPRKITKDRTLRYNNIVYIQRWTSFGPNFYNWQILQGFLQRACRATSLSDRLYWLIMYI